MAYKKFIGDYLFTGTTMLGGDNVLITDERGGVQAIVPMAEAGEGIEKLSGIISPGFINCHCHLELSHMKGALPEHTGLVNFILAILQQRHASEDTIYAAMAKAETEMLNNGIVAVGDISNNFFSLEQKKKQRLYYHNFIEVSGFSPAMAQHRFDAAMQVYDVFLAEFPAQTSLVPHSPYSVSPKLFQLIDGITGTISSIHNQETAAENEFYLTGKGDFNRLYETIGVNLNAFYQPSGKSSLQTVLPLVSKPQQLLLVHDTFTTQPDIDWLQSLPQAQQYFFCICANANLYIENKLPPVDLFLQNNCLLVIGTDSLASNHSLSILDEIITITKQFSQIPLPTILQWATLNSAKALQMDSHLGSFEPGKKPGVIQITNLNEDGAINKDSKVKVIL
ncbi:amidohydrolase family protein [Parasediminibacterium sp. JCM 36343]|uniref:amidohydrolase family protein n=1 Tax=Parasediminibacterium sp. JCM 36343 TaxID=3374279 RepID=UPI0039784434